MLDLNPSGGMPARNPVSGGLRVPLLSALAQRLRNGGRSVILDFGPARSGTIAFCNRFNCRIEIADLARDLGTLNDIAEPVEIARRAEALLPPRGADPADLVLCWDLLNYLQRPALAALMDRVAGRTRAGTLVHALIVYSAVRMPAQPCTWLPVFDVESKSGDDIRLVGIPCPAGEREAPRYTPDDLRRCLPAYRLDRGTLLSNGMQELLFRL